MYSMTDSTKNKKQTNSTMQWIKYKLFLGTVIKVMNFKWSSKIQGLDRTTKVIPKMGAPSGLDLILLTLSAATDE